MYSYVDNTYFDTNTKGSFENWYDLSLRRQRQCNSAELEK